MSEPTCPKCHAHKVLPEKSLEWIYRYEWDENGSTLVAREKNAGVLSKPKRCAFCRVFKGLMR